jgi:hypothetical protein
MNYLLFEEGQRTYLAESVEPARTGMDPAWVPKGIKLHVNNPEIGDKIGYYQKLFADIFGAPAS